MVQDDQYAMEDEEDDDDACDIVDIVEEEAFVV